MYKRQVEDAELNSRLNQLMTQITEQGERIAKHTDIADMKRYREDVYKRQLVLLEIALGLAS